MVHPYNGVLLGNKKKLNTDQCYNMDELWNNTLSERNQLLKATFCNCHLYDVLEEAKSLEPARRLVPTDWGGQGWTASEDGGSLWGRDTKLYSWAVGTVVQLIKHAKKPPHSALHLNMSELYVCELCLNRAVMKI